MKKFVKAGLMLVLGLTLVAPGMTTPANAASKVKVVSTTGIAKTAYHGKKGYIYSSAKLTKKKHNMRNYKYTTWYGTKKATIKKTGKKQASLTYIKVGKKHGWIYSKYLTAGKAPINKDKLRQNDIVKYNRALMSAASDTQRICKADLNSSYEQVGSNLGDEFGLWQDSVSEITKNKNALLNIYAIFKGRFTTTQNTNLNAMANQLENEQVTEGNSDDVYSQVRNFAGTLGDLMANLD